MIKALHLFLLLLILLGCKTQTTNERQKTPRGKNAYVRSPVYFPPGLCPADSVDLAAEKKFEEAYNVADSVVLHEIGPVIYGSGKKIQSPMSGDHFLPHRLKHIKTLSPESFEKVDRAIFHFSEPDGRVQCYTPRHGISFYKADKIFIFVEICFECSQVTCSALSLPVRHLCTENRVILKEVFEN